MSSPVPPPAGPRPLCAVPVLTPPLSPFSWRLLAPADREAMDALHRRAIGAAGPDVVKPESPDFFARILGGGGRAIGVFDGERLLAYGIVQHVLPDADDPRPLLSLPPEVMRVKLAGASVAPELRGKGLQRALIAARVKLALADFAGSALLLYSTSAPANVRSWTNLMAEAFEIRAIKLYYGGHPRYVMVRADGHWRRGAEMTVDPGDLDQQRALLAQGWRGIAVSLDAGPPRIVFAAPAASDAPFAPSAS